MKRHFRSGSRTDSVRVGRGVSGADTKFEVACMDAVGRARAARVFGAGFGRVAVQVPPGESMILTLNQLHELWVLAREVCGPWPDDATVRSLAASLDESVA